MNNVRALVAFVCLFTSLSVNVCQAAKPDARLAKVLASKNETIRMQAIQALRNDPQHREESLSQLITVAKADAAATAPNELARPSMVDLLGLIGMVNHPEAKQLLIELLDSPHLGTAIVAADVLGKNKVTAAIDSLKKQFNRPEYAASYGFRFNLIRALALMDHPDAIECLELQRPKLDGQLRYEIDKLLANVTAGDFQGDAKRYAAWQASRETKIQLTSGGSESEERERMRLGGPQQYYGIDIHAKRMMFIIDNSGSMREADEGGSRLYKAKFELVKAIEQLPRDSEFAITYYSTKIYQWQPELMIASDENKRAAIAFVGDLGFGNLTNTYGALRLSLEFDSDLEAVYLLTDGRPTTGNIVSPSAIVSDIVHRNRFRNLNFNSIGIALDPDTEMFLRTLSEESGGEFRKAN